MTTASGIYLFPKAVRAVLHLASRRKVVDMVAERVVNLRLEPPEEVLPVMLPSVSERMVKAFQGDLEYPAATTAGGPVAVAAVLPVRVPTLIIVVAGPLVEMEAQVSRAALLVLPSITVAAAVVPQEQDWVPEPVDSEAAAMAGEVLPARMVLRIPAVVAVAVVTAT